tara:strand:+ start:981 stop:1868 length:888 start_codon:yes stop_codon:yes gene_type:complete
MKYKKVISFSLWGDNPFYNVGAIRNVELAKEYFGGWICRFYIGTSTPKDTIEELKSHDNVEIIMMDSDEGWDGMYWRFYPINDEEVDIMISRDVDCRLSNRDSHAVNEWLKSGKILHIMRDHPMHSEPIMGGMWGCRTKELFENIIQEIYEPFPELPKPSHIKDCIRDWTEAEKIKTKMGGHNTLKLEQYNNHGIDQKFLRNVVYKTSYKEAWIHDSFPMYNSWSGRFDEQRPVGLKELNTGFPTMRIDWNDFIGQIYFEDETPNEESSEFLKQRDECIYMDYPKHDEEKNEKSN